MGRLRVGSLMLVARAEAAPAATDGREGLLVSQGVQLYPNLGEPLPAGTANTAFFLRALPRPAALGSRRPSTSSVANGC